MLRASSASGTEAMSIPRQSIAPGFASANDTASSFNPAGSSILQSPAVAHSQQSPLLQEAASKPRDLASTMSAQRQQPLDLGEI